MALPQALAYHEGGDLHALSREDREILIRTVQEVSPCFA